MRGAIFDMDGLLLDSEKLYQRCWHELAQELGAVLPRDFASQITGGGREHSRVVLGKYYPMVDPDELMTECRARVTVLEEAEMPMKPGAAELVEALHDAGWRLAVASSSPRDMVVRNLERTGLAKWIDCVVCGGETERGKPFPDIILLAAERLGLRPEECMVLEDSPNGLEAARAAGSLPVMVPDMVPPTDELYTFCRIYASLCDVLDAVSSGQLQ